jgi:hypothetical protein
MCTTGINDTGGKFATGDNDTGGNLPPVSTTPAAIFPPVSLVFLIPPPVSLTPVAKYGKKYQAADSLKRTSRQKSIYVNSTPQRWPNKIIKIFLIEDFFHLLPVSSTPVANLELPISPRIFEKFRNGPNCIIRGLGVTDL